jgi:hypothetical protein
VSREGVRNARWEVKGSEKSVGSTLHLTSPLTPPPPSPFTHLITHTLAHAAGPAPALAGTPAPSSPEAERALAELWRWLEESASPRGLDDALASQLALEAAGGGGGGGKAEGKVGAASQGPQGTGSVEAGAGAGAVGASSAALGGNGAEGREGEGGSEGDHGPAATAAGAGGGGGGAGAGGGAALHQERLRTLWASQRMAALLARPLDARLALWGSVWEPLLPFHVMRAMQVGAADAPFAISSAPTTAEGGALGGGEGSAGRRGAWGRG